MTFTFLSGQPMAGENAATLKARVSSRVLRQRLSAAIAEPPVSKKDLRKPRSENVGADKGFFVDHTCIGTFSHQVFLHRLAFFLYILLRASWGIAGVQNLAIPEACSTDDCTGRIVTLSRL